MKVGDYIIFHDDAINKKQNLLGKVEKLNPLLVRLQPDVFGRLSTTEVSRKSILCGLGQTPNAGKVYGVELTNIYRTTVEVDKFGKLLFYYAPEKPVRRALKAAFRIAAKQLEAQKLYSIFDGQVIYSIKHSHCPGLFTASDNEEVPSHIDLDPEATTIDDLPHVILHEMGHYYFNLLDDDWQFKWVQLYTTFVKMDKFSVKEMKALKENFVHSGMSFFEFQKTLDDPELTYFKMVHKHLCRAFKLRPKQLDPFYEADQEAVLAKWPSSSCKVEYETPVSQYASKSYHELFAESFSFYLLGIKLPEKVNSLMKKTISVLRL